MKRRFLYLAIAILAFWVGTFFALNFYSQNSEEIINRQIEEENIVSNSLQQTKRPIVNTNDFINFDDLTIKGIGLGRENYEKDVIKALGKPNSIKNTDFNCLWDIPAKTLAYNGLRLTLVYEPVGNYDVYEVELTSNKWQLDSGIKIGDDIELVKQKIGKNFFERAEKGRIFLQFDNDDGWARMYFRNNKLEKVHWLYNYC